MSGVWDRAGQGPLAGVRVLEVAALGPVAHAVGVMAQLGATAHRVTRPGHRARSVFDDHRTSEEVDLKLDSGRDRALALVDEADVLVEGFRPGVMERLGLGPQDCAARNPGLVYVRLTGWGQSGPLAHAAGHDLNYLALSGALHHIQVDGTPAIPLNLVADMAGGALGAVVGATSALVQRARTGRGGVVDSAMCDGLASLMTPLWSRIADGLWSPVPGANEIDGGAPFYACYPTADGRHLAVASVEPQFYARMVELFDLEVDLAAQWDRSGWPALREALARRIASRSLAEWTELAAAVDACITPVLTPKEAGRDPHLRDRGAVAERAGHVVPGPPVRYRDHETA